MGSETKDFTWLLGSQGTDRATSDCLQDTTRYFLGGKRAARVSQSPLRWADGHHRWLLHARPVLSPVGTGTLPGRATGDSDTQKRAAENTWVQLVLQFTGDWQGGKQQTQTPVPQCSLWNGSHAISPSEGLCKGRSA